MGDGREELDGDEVGRDEWIASKKKGLYYSPTNYVQRLDFLLACPSTPQLDLSGYPSDSCYPCVLEGG